MPSFIWRQEFRECWRCRKCGACLWSLSPYHPCILPCHSMPQACNLKVTTSTLSQRSNNMAKPLVGPQAGYQVSVCFVGGGVRPPTPARRGSRPALQSGGWVQDLPGTKGRAIFGLHDKVPKYNRKKSKRPIPTTPLPQSGGMPFPLAL